jgi:hypothetical protein
MMKFFTTTLLLAPIAFALSGCGNASPCAEPGVLQTLKTLHDEQQFGQFIQAPPTVFTVQDGSATFVSIDKQGGKDRCSAIIVSDIIEMMKFTNQYSEADIEKIKEKAPKMGMALTKEYVVNYTVQPMANGQNYVTVLP